MFITKLGGRKVFALVITSANILLSGIFMEKEVAQVAIYALGTLAIGLIGGNVLKAKYTEKKHEQGN